MIERKDLLKSFYDNFEEDKRLVTSRQGQLEYLSSMHFIHKYIKPNSKILEIGAGTGRYSIALAKEGFNVSSVELLESNLKVLREHSKGLNNIESFQGDAIDLSRFPENTFDATLSFGPLYHLYNKDDVLTAIKEALRVTKKGGVIMFAFLSIYALMDTNYVYGNWAEGMETNYDKDMKLFHAQEQLFTGYDIKEFEDLFVGLDCEYVSTVGVDSDLEALESKPNFAFTDEDFKSYVAWHIANAEKRELLGRNNHLLYICKKK